MPIAVFICVQRLELAVRPTGQSVPKLEINYHFVQDVFIFQIATWNNRRFGGALNVSDFWLLPFRVLNMLISYKVDGEN